MARNKPISFLLFFFLIWFPSKAWGQGSISPGDETQTSPQSREQPRLGSEATSSPSQNTSPASGQQSRIDPTTGLVRKNLRYSRFSFGLDYLVFGGQFLEGFTPSVASNITGIFEPYHSLGKLMFRLRPEALVSVIEARREAKSSFAFQEQIRQGARAILAQALKIPLNQVDLLVPRSVITATEAKVRVVANKAVDDRIGYSAAVKTAVDGIMYSKRFGDFEFGVGKDHPFFAYDFLPSDSSVIFGSVPNAYARYQNEYIVPMLRVYHDRKSIESPFGVANAYVRAVLREGAGFFSINPNSAEMSAAVQPALLRKMGLRSGVGALIFGAGSRDGDPYGFLRLDFSLPKAHMRNVVNWQDTNFGMMTQYSMLARFRLISRLLLGTGYYLHTGTPDSFYQLQPFLDIVLRRRPWAGWMGDYQTHFVVKRGYAKGELVHSLTGESDLVKDWNIEIQMVRPGW